MAGAQIATLTILGALMFVVLIIWNWYFFHRLDVSFSEWLKDATSRQRIFAFLDGAFVILYSLEILGGVLFFLI